MAKVKSGEIISLIELARIAESPDYRTATTIFNTEPGDQRYVGRAVAWKGKKGEAFATSAPAEVVKGLDKAIVESKKCAKVYGVGRNPLTGGMVPNKVLCQMKNAGKIKK